jgi:outer membrane protein assembly factor BamB
MRGLTVAFLCLLSVTVSAQWPQWRGPQRTGVAPANIAPAAWPETPTLKWKQSVGEGYSSPVVDGGRIFVHHRQDPDEIVTAFDLVSGKPLWTARYPATFNKSQYAARMSKGPFSTPLVANGRLFTLGTTAVLTSFDAKTGDVKWRKDWSNEISTARMFTGTAMSPVIADGLLIVHVGDDDAGAFRAFDPATGAEKWTLPGHGPGYASPVIRGSQLITMTDKAVVGVNLTSGALLWQIPFPDEWNENIVTPTFTNDILIVSGVRKGTFGYRLNASGAPTQVWHNPELPMYMSSPVVDGNFVYGFSNRRKGQLFCLDAATGTAKWATEGRAAMNASLVSAGPNLVVLTTEGELLVVRRTTEKYDELRRYKVADAQTWAQPVLLGDQMVIRDASSVALWSLK